MLVKFVLKQEAKLFTEVNKILADLPEAFPSPDSPNPIPNFLFYSLVDSFPALLQSQGIYTIHAMKFFLRITSVHPDGAFLFVDFCAE